MCWGKADIFEGQGWTDSSDHSRRTATSMGVTQENWQSKQLKVIWKICRAIVKTSLNPPVIYTRLIQLFDCMASLLSHTEQPAVGSLWAVAGDVAGQLPNTLRNGVCGICVHEVIVLTNASLIDLSWDALGVHCCPVVIHQITIYISCSCYLACST